MSLIQFRRGTTSTWGTANTILAPAEPGVDVTTHDIKIGDGVTPWSTLPSATLAALKALLTTDGDLISRIGGVISRMTRDTLAQDPAFNTRYVSSAGTAWTAYTPTFTASTTNPIVGTDGVRTGRWMQIAKTCWWWVTIQFGTAGGGTSGGSGVYTIGLPPPALSASVPVFTTVGSGHAVLAGVRYNLEVLLSGVALVQMFAPVGPISTTSPGVITYADSIRLSGVYETA